MPSDQYVPSREAWANLSTSAAGFDAARLQAAIDFSVASECTWPRSMYLPDGQYIGTAHIGDKAEHAEVLGPVVPRGGPNGLVLRHGKLVAAWGDTRHVDMTFSVTKSYIGILAGIAVADGLIADLDAPVGQDVDTGWFEGAHNARITWRHLLQQTSEWQGTLWGKPDSADHNRAVGGTASGGEQKGARRELQAPGTHYEYNDVRVNLLAACLTHRFRRALPDVLKERVMDPIGASDEWRWHGYRNASLELNGKSVPCVPGGGHWGGGMVISSDDHARMGLLISRAGSWGGRQIVAADWVEKMLTPSPALAQYGLLWWLNGAGGKRYPSATERSVFAQGAGASIVWIERDLDLVVVTRWIAGEAVDGLIARVLAALR
jgi:CubicO group peptidase (beta-lactamase class C family)